MLGLRSARGISQIVEMNRVAVQAGLADLQRLALFVVVDLVQGRAGQGRAGQGRAGQGRAAFMCSLAM